MGKLSNTLIGISLLGLIFLGVCNKKGLNKITGLETKIKNDSIASSKDHYMLSKLLKDTTLFYSDSLKKTLNLYDKNLLESEKLNKKVSELSRKIKKHNFLKGLEGNYNFLVNKYDSLKNEKDKLFVLYQKEISKNQELISLLTENTNLSGDKYSNFQQSEKTKKNFNVKNQNFFRNWKSLAPKLFSVSEESISFKDNDPKEMEAFALYHETGRLEPLKKISEGDKLASFAYPQKFLELQEGAIDVYAIDKNKNESGRRAIYKSGGIISRKEIID